MFIRNLTSACLCATVCPALTRTSATVPPRVERMLFFIFMASMISMTLPGFNLIAGLDKDLDHRSGQGRGQLIVTPCLDCWIVREHRQVWIRPLLFGASGLLSVFRVNFKFLTIHMGNDGPCVNIFDFHFV